MTDVLALRQQLRESGYCPIPLYGKEPPIYGKNNKHKGLDGWQTLNDITPEQIELWSKLWPDAQNTGILTQRVPTLDLDILNEEAAEGCENYTHEQYEDRGSFLVRIGKAPKRAILFRTDEPFAKIVINLSAANGNSEKIEFLCDGQQVVVDGIHPDTQQPYDWFGGQPGPISRDDLPYIREQEARVLVDALVDLLVRDFGYTRAAERPKKAGGNGVGAPADWQYLTDNIQAGRELHDSLRDLAAKLITAGMAAGAAVNYLRALLTGSAAPRDKRWQERDDDIPRLVRGAEELKEEKEEQARQAAQAAAATQAAQARPPSTLEQTLEVFDRWLILKDHTPIYAVLGALAANLLPGDPVWLGLVGPPSSAKTEILNSTSLVPNVVQASTLTAPGLLSGVPRRQQTATAKGGLLRQIGSFGIIVLKDFGSILSMRPDLKAELLAALREIYDGAWTRHIGSDGGRTLTWKGKVGLLFGSTGVIDVHYSVFGAMGDRFLLNRLAPIGKGQFEHALKHVGTGAAQMRKELAEAVANLFAGLGNQPQPMIDADEIYRLDRTLALVVKLRGSVERDRIKREIEAVHGAEGPARIGLMLERLLAGLSLIGVDRETALEVVETVAMDSVPPLRRKAYECLAVAHPRSISTTAVAKGVKLPTNTVRRGLEDLAAYAVAERLSQGQGKADLWRLL